MKDFRLELRLRNNQLVERREALGWSQAEFARRVGVNLHMYNGLECLRAVPLDFRGGWLPVAVRLAEIHGVDPSVLWPDAIKAVQNPVVVKRVSANEMSMMLDEGTPEPLPDNALDRKRLRERLSALVDSLPARQQTALRMRYGLDGEEHTLEEIGAVLGVCTERARSICVKALRNLRHVSRRTLLEPFLELE